MYVGGGVGEQLEDHQVHVGGPELVSGLHGLFLRCDDAPVDELHGGGDAGLEVRVLGLEFRDKGRELGQLGPQGDGKDAHPGFGFDQHSINLLFLT